MSDPIALWKQFQDGDISARNKLALHYLPLVDRVIRGLPHFYDRDDAASDGAIGLLDAISKFDTTRWDQTQFEQAVPFESYASLRIRGAIVDGHRSVDSVPRLVRSKRAAISKTIETLSHRGSAPSVEEIAAHTGMKVKEVSETISRSYAPLPDQRFDNPAEAGEDYRTASFEMPGENLDIDHLRNTVATSFHAMDDRERVLFALYYDHDLSFADIGTVLGITEARVGQIHLKAIRDLYVRVSA